jgi:cytidine deaminase
LFNDFLDAILGIMIAKEVQKKLLQAATEAREHAYAPYSNDFKVGAAVLTEDGSIFCGCNIENASFGATICAERVAIFKAVCEGRRKIIALAVIADQQEPIPPCGLCLQVVSEFGKDADIIMANTRGKVIFSNMIELLPVSFEFKNRKHDERY